MFDEVLNLKLLGKKTGKGFYIHDAKERQVNSQVQAMVKGSGRATDEEALMRMTHIMINEAALILQEGIVDSADTVDIGMIMGTGFPPFRGGAVAICRFFRH